MRNEELFQQALLGDWPNLSLTEAFEVIRGITFESGEKQDSPGDGLVACLRTANIQEEVDWYDLIYVPQGRVKREDQRVKLGDILISMANSRELVGKVALVKEVPVECSFGAFIAVLRSRLLDPQFGYHLLRSRRVQDQLRETSTRTVNIANLSLRGMKLVSVPVPPLEDQRLIVAKIESLTAKSRRARESLKAIPPLIEKFRQSVLAAAFRGDLTAEWRKKNPDVEPASELLKRIRVERRRRWEEAEHEKLKAKGKVPKDDKWKAKYKEPEPVDTTGLPELPEGWAWTTVDAATDVVLGRQRAPQYLTGKFTRRYLRVANIKDDRIDYSDLESMDFDDDDYPKYRLLAGDVLVSEGQSLELVGQSAIYDGTVEDLCFQKTLHRVRSITHGPGSRYVQMVFRAWLRTRVFRRFASITTNIAHLTLEKFKQVPFPLAPQSEQSAIVDCAEELLGRCEAADAALERARGNCNTADQSILAKAFRGELVDIVRNKSSLTLEGRG